MKYESLLPTGATDHRRPTLGTSEPYKAPWQGASLVNSTNEPISYLTWDYKVSLWGVSTILPGEKHVFTEKSAYIFLRFEDGTDNYYRLASRAFAQPPTKDELEHVEPNYILGVRRGEDEVWWQLYYNGEEIDALA